MTPPKKVELVLLYYGSGKSLCAVDLSRTTVASSSAELGPLEAKRGLRRIEGELRKVESWEPKKEINPSATFGVLQNLFNSSALQQMRVHHFGAKQLRWCVGQASF